MTRTSSLTGEGPSATAVGAILSKVFVIVQTAFSLIDSEIVLVENVAL